MARGRIVVALAAVCRLRAVIANQNMGNRTTCHQVPTWPLIPCGLCVRERETEQTREIKNERETPAVVVLC